MKIKLIILFGLIFFIFSLTGKTAIIERSDVSKSSLDTSIIIVIPSATFSTEGNNFLLIFSKKYPIDSIELTLSQGGYLIESSSEFQQAMYLMTLKEGFVNISIYKKGSAHKELLAEKQIKVIRSFSTKPEEDIFFGNFKKNYIPLPAIMNVNSFEVSKKYRIVGVTVYFIVRGFGEGPIVELRSGIFSEELKKHFGRMKSCSSFLLDNIKVVDNRGVERNLAPKTFTFF